MSWVWNNGTIDTYNIRSSSGTYLMYQLKNLLKTVGWTVLMSGDGLSAYNGSGDVFTTHASGATGLDNTNAWFRIEDPASGREYVFQRGANHYSWLWHYSASSGFTGGTPSATAIPTATDKQNLAKRVATAQDMFPTSYDYICHMAAQNSAEGGVYSWYLLVVQPGEASHQTFMFCEAMDTRYNAGGADTDPCIHVGSDDTLSYTSYASTVATGGDAFSCYMVHGGGSAEYQGVSALFYLGAGATAFPGSVGSNPHTGRLFHPPIYWARHTSTGSTPGFKGMSKFLRWKSREATSVAQKYPKVLHDSDSNEMYVVWEDMVIPGWPDGVSPEV